MKKVYMLVNTLHVIRNVWILLRDVILNLITAQWLILSDYKSFRKFVIFCMLLSYE